jgi:hypothetical protein
MSDNTYSQRPYMEVQHALDEKANNILFGWNDTWALRGAWTSTAGPQQTLQSLPKSLLGTTFWMPANIFDWDPARKGLTADTWESAFTRTGLDRNHRYYFKGRISETLSRLRCTGSSNVQVASFELDVWPGQVFQSVVDHNYYKKYMCAESQLPEDAVKCTVLPIHPNVDRAPGAAGGSDEDSAGSGDSGHPMDAPAYKKGVEGGGSRVVKLDPARAADIFGAFPLTATSIEGGLANENTTLFVVRGQKGRLSMSDDLRGILLATDGSYSRVLWLTEPPLHVRHPCNQLLDVCFADASEAHACLPTPIPELIDCQGRSSRSSRSSTSSQPQSQTTNISQVTDASASQSTDTWHDRHPESQGEEVTPTLMQLSGGNIVWDCNIYGHTWTTQLSIAGAYDVPPSCTTCGQVQAL